MKMIHDVTATPQKTPYLREVADPYPASPFKTLDADALRQQRYLELGYRVMQQFVRLFMGRMSCDVMQQLLSRALVEEGRRSVQQSQEGKLVLSRVALLTGVKTQTVKDLAQSPPLHYPEGLTVEAVILQRWAHDPRYQSTPNGPPARLLIHGSGPTFQRLVAVVAGRGITTQTVLERLLEQGNVVVVNSHWLELVNSRWQPETPQQTEAFVQNVESWLAAANP